jgi:hypothetical protein
MGSSPLNTDMALVVLLLINTDRHLNKDMVAGVLLSSNSMDKARMEVGVLLSNNSMEVDMVNSNTLPLVV